LAEVNAATNAGIRSEICIRMLPEVGVGGNGRPRLSPLRGRSCCADPT
jgi:hypothetical protein